MKRLSLLIIPFLILRCAAVGSPPGGPKDITAPSLVSVSPPSGTTEIKGGLTLELTFSERLHEETNANELRVSPSLVAPLDIKLNKEVMLVSFPSNLVSNQTYILTLTRELMDERKNRLDKTYQIALSTGKNIASGRISGTIHELKEKSSSLVYLFVQGEIPDDSLLLRAPQYYTETDDSGHYVFDYLAQGIYTTVAHTGGSPPAPVSSLRSVYGLYWKTSVALGKKNEIVENVDMLLGHEVPSFRVLSVAMDDSVSGTITFTNPFDLKALPEAKVDFVSAYTKASVGVTHLFQYPDSSKELRFFIEGLIGGESYFLKVAGLKDSVDQVLELVDRQVRVPKTDGFRLSINDPALNEITSIEPGPSPFNIQFTKPFSVISDSAIICWDKAGDTLNIAWKIEDTVLKIFPDGKWLEESSYELKLFGDKILSADGFSMSDSVLTLAISTGSLTGTGGLMGYVLGPYVEGSIVTAKSLEKKPEVFSVSVNLDGEFIMEQIPEGQWLLSAFQDIDSNGRYSYGKLYKHTASEPFTILTDTIQVRSNWDIDGIVLTYPGKSEK